MSTVPIFDINGNRIGPRLPMRVGNRYKVFIPSKAHLFSGLKSFHEKIVTITSLSKNVMHVFIKTDDSPALFSWIDPDWLFTINAQGKCICEISTLTTSGCKCGGS